MTETLTTIENNTETLENELDSSKEAIVQNQPITATNTALKTTHSNEEESISLIPSENATTIVKWQFGNWIGPVVGDYPCSFGNYSGRLYAGWNAICFYSNLFGFERKLSIKYNDIVTLELYRNTSILVKTSGEEFIFRSFSDRNHVYHILEALKDKRVKKKGKRHLSDSGSPSKDLSKSLGSVDVDHNAKRLNLIKDENEGKMDDSQELQSTLNESISSKIEESVTAKSTQEPSKMDIQELYKSFEATYTEVAIKDYILKHCNLNTFYTLFLQDDAKYSVEYFQRNVIKDMDLHTTQWTLSSSNDHFKTYSRTIEFVHSVNVPVGASTTRGTKYQTLQRINDTIIIINTTTVLYDCHNADCFQVQDQWMIEDVSDEHHHKVKLSIRFYVDFLKYTMWKHVIDKMTKSNTIASFDKYKGMITSTIHTLYHDKKLESMLWTSSEDENEDVVPHVIEDSIQPKEVSNTMSDNVISITLNSSSSKVLIMILSAFLLCFMIICCVLWIKLYYLEYKMNVMLENFNRLSVILQDKQVCNRDVN